MSITGCSFLKPYQAELGQGNFILESQVEQLATGQTAKQVLFILGTPLLTGELRDLRWHYPTYEGDSGYSMLTIEFENGLVSKISRR